MTLGLQLISSQTMSIMSWYDIGTQMIRLVGGETL
jgi:hypothetical protein